MSWKLEFELRKELLKQKLLPVIVLLGVGVFAVFMLPSAKYHTTKVLHGEVIGLRGVEGDGVKLLLEVKLDSGLVVLVRIPRRQGYYQKGKRVRVMQRQSNFMSGYDYAFDRYTSER